METMHAAGRRNLPPVPRPAPDATAVRAGLPRESPAERTMELRRRTPEETPEQMPDDISDDAIDDGLADDDTTVFRPQFDGPAHGSPTEPHHDVDPDADLDVDPDVLAVADEPEHALEEDDPAQGFVTRLRAAAADFAAAAGAETAVVREAVPPARHRRSRCRVVLRYPDGAEADLTFLGSVGRPGTAAWEGFDRQIERWLGTGQERHAAWLVEDTDAPDGVAVDVPAWLAAG